MLTGMIIERPNSSPAPVLFHGISHRLKKLIPSSFELKVRAKDKVTVTFQMKDELESNLCCILFELFNKKYNDFYINVVVLAVKNIHN